MARTLIVLLMFLLLGPASARAALLSNPDCDDRLPQVLNVGLPQTAELPRFVGEIFEQLYRDHGRCKETRRLQVNIAVGNDYQILDWLGRRLVDVAVVPSLSLYLLERDKVGLLELDFGETAAELPGSDREAEFVAFRQAVWCASLAGEQKGPPAFDAERRRCAALRAAPQRIDFPSHLSTRGFLAPVAGITTWMEGKLGPLDLPEDEREGLQNRFWSKVFENVRFTLEEEGEGDRDHLVITKSMANTLFDVRPGGFELRMATVPEGFRSVLETLDRNPPLTAFRSLFEVDPYFGARTFGFTVEESMALLRQHQQTSGRARLALLLPGGGVKAAYQSRLVDELYRRRYLENVLAPDSAVEPRPLDVDLVVGTSGGALLGYFVSRLAKNGPWTLSQVLWEKEPRVVMDSADVFGLLDLPRYVSVLAIFLTFAVLLALLSLPHRPLIKAGLPPERGAWRLRPWLTLWPVILLVPVFVRTVNGSFSQEHIPEIEGLFYVICASIAMFADQCLILKAGEEATERKKPPVHPVVPALAGLVLVTVPLLPVWGEEGSGRWIDGSAGFITAGALLVCLGCLCLLAASFLSTCSSKRYRLEGARDFGIGFSLSLFHVLAVYGVLVVVMKLWPGRFSLLEMTGGFWAWLLAVAFGVGALLVGIGCARRQGTICRGIRFLCSHHPNGSLVSRRFLRLAVITVVALVWWNFVLAPALYGNKHARTFLEGTVARFKTEYERVNPNQDSRRLTAQLLVPANALERDGTRYFLMVPDRLLECPSIAWNPGTGASWHQYRVRSGELPPGSPSCPEVQDVSPGEVEKVIFASGSPFPIFPAHRVEIPGEKDEKGRTKAQALVDGGYSSNVPVDAARTVFAEQVLIIESENPLGHGSSADDEEGWWQKIPRLPGPLVADVLRLPGYLFERSQQVDRLSKRDLFVLSLSPSRDEKDWPLLIDFREPVVRRMRDVAEQDLKRRIGLVESWGPPRFQLSVQVGGRSS
ncbi:MAG TPA: hypothetical protein VLQ45_33740 [Thermoanaerobaculia bacterium]|nr:hypothetical protein [Thermoanaerobaculia bacterium]